MKARFAYVLFPAILLAAFLASCLPPYHEKDERYVFVAFNTSLPYWQEAEAGLTDSAKQLGVKAELTGPATFSPNDEVAAFQQAVSQKPAGILLAAATPEPFREPINAAVQQSIPVICVDADSPESNRVLFVGTDNLRAGQESGRRMGELLKGKGNIVVVTVIGQFNLGERLRGVNEALKKFPGIKITKTIDDKGDPRNAYDAISALVSGKDKPDGIIGLEASAGAGAADALHRVDLTGKIPIVAFDKDPETLDWIERGAITATVVQKPYVMAYYGLKFLDDLHHNAVHDFKDWRTAPTPSMPAWVDTGTAIVDKKNLAAFREALAAHPKPM
jgi:ribose transport system substrate-binding protein